MTRKGYEPKKKSALIAVRVTDELDEFLSEVSIQSKCTKPVLIRSMIEHCKTIAVNGALDIKEGA